MHDSILEADSVYRILEMAKQNLEQYGSLQPLLFLQLQTGDRLLTALELPAVTSDKIRYMHTLGEDLLTVGKVADEAVMVAEGWFVGAKEGALDPSTPPSLHPARREAIVLVGRNAARTRFSSMLRPFSRDPEGKLIWQETEMDAVNTVATSEFSLAGLLDYLFVDPVTRECA